MRRFTNDPVSIFGLLSDISIPFLIIFLSVFPGTDFLFAVMKSHSSEKIHSSAAKSLVYSIHFAFFGVFDNQLERVSGYTDSCWI